MTRASENLREGRAALDVRGQRRSAQLRIDGAAVRALNTAKSRLVVGALLFAAAFFAVTVRLVDVGVMTSTAPSAGSPASGATSVALRGDVFDRNGLLLATSLPTWSLFARPKNVGDIDEAVNKLARILQGATAADLRAKLTSKSPFVWLRRHLSPSEQAAVHGLGLPWLDFQVEQRRVYPHGSAASHVIGFGNIDGDGLAGLELSLNARLEHGEAVTSSIDLRLQTILREELAAQIGKFRALGGAAVVMDARNGEVIAMVSLPDFDANDPGAADANARFSRATLGVYELGSVFKVFTLATALDAGTTNFRRCYDVGHPLMFAGKSIADFHPGKGCMSVPGIFGESSNIGAARIALEYGSDVQRRYLKQFGLLSATGVELSEIGLPMFPSTWREVNTATVAFGHGVAVSPLQFTASVAAIINGGILRTPTLVKQNPMALRPGVRVISEDSSDKMRRLFRYVVTNGTAKLASVKGYVVGGKTGTAEKIENGHYKKNANISSFVGAFPINAPRYVVYALIDEPKGLKETAFYATGGWTAAPMVGRVIARIAPLLGIAPQDETAPEVLRALAIDQEKAGPRLAAN
ncbi:MAG: penicillin-binding protein 2 [Alphaproteobacteria bacterium]|nr:penicillin-binding protein 2 [Alphaproteobacteria bacterium]